MCVCVCVCVREKEKVCLCVCIRTLHAGCQALVMHAQCNNKAHNKIFYYILFSRLLFAYLAAPKPTVPMEQGASACKNGNMPITHIHRFTTTTHTYTHLHIDKWKSLIYMHMYVNRHANAETAKRGVSKPLSVYIWMCVWVLYMYIYLYVCVSFPRALCFLAAFHTLFAVDICHALPFILLREFIKTAWQSEHNNKTWKMRMHVWT